MVFFSIVLNDEYVNVAGYSDVSCQYRPGTKTHQSRPKRRAIVEGNVPTDCTVLQYSAAKAGVEMAGLAARLKSCPFQDNEFFRSL
jgi:hypothetical protein